MNADELECELKAFIEEGVSFRIEMMGGTVVECIRGKYSSQIRMVTGYAIFSTHGGGLDVQEDKDHVLLHAMGDSGGSNKWRSNGCVEIDPYNIVSMGLIS